MNIIQTKGVLQEIDGRIVHGGDESKEEKEGCHHDQWEQILVTGS